MTTRSKLDAIAASIRAHSAILANEVRSMSQAELRRWVKNNPETLANILRSTLHDPAIVLPTILAARDNSTASAFGGDPIMWFAAQLGITAPEANAYLRTARWLYRSAHYPIEGPDRVNQARAAQAQLRDIFAANHSSLAVIATCKRQTDFLCQAAKPQIVPIIKAVLTAHGPYPNPKTLVADLQQAVHEANRAFQPDLGNHSYIRFSRVRAGMMAFSGFCTSREGSMIQSALRRIVKDKHLDVGRPAEKAEFQALKLLASNVIDGSGANGGTGTDSGAEAAANNIRYRVNVVITADELRRLETGQLQSVRTDRNEHIDWETVRRGRISPIDAVTVIGRAGAQMRELAHSRWFSPEQRDWMLAFQVYCAHPGCTVPARDCQAHHIIPVAAGGPTTTDNLVLVCAHHHARNDDSAKIPGRFHYAKDADGIPYLQTHPPNPQSPTPPPQYNEANLLRSAAKRR